MDNKVSSQEITDYQNDCFSKVTRVSNKSEIERQYWRVAKHCDHNRERVREDAFHYCGRMIAAYLRYETREPAIEIGSQKVSNRMRNTRHRVNKG